MFILDAVMFIIDAVMFILDAVMFIYRTRRSCWITYMYTHITASFVAVVKDLTTAVAVSQSSVGLLDITYPTDKLILSYLLYI